MVFIGLLLATVAVSGCGFAEGGLMSQLQQLGPMVCEVYDFDGDGILTTDELREVFGEMFSEEELQEVIEFYGCNAS